MDAIPAAHAATEETDDLIRSVGLYVEECERIATIDHVTESLAYGADHLNRSARWFLDGRRADHHSPPSTRIIRGPVSTEEANAIEAVATRPVELEEFKAQPLEGRKPLVYLASPYSHPDPVVRERRFRQASLAAAKLLQDGRVLPFSPIAHSHPIAVHGGMTEAVTNAWAHWQELDLAFIDRCDALAVLELTDWQASVGVAAEVEYAAKRGMPILHIDPFRESVDRFVTIVLASCRSFAATSG